MGKTRKVQPKKGYRKKRKTKISQARQRAIDRSDSVFDAHLSFSSESPVLHTNLQDTIWGRYPDIGIKAKDSSNPNSTPNIDGADLGRMFTRVTGLDFQTGEPDVEIIGNKPHIEIIFGYEKVKPYSPYFKAAVRKNMERRLVYNKGYLLSKAEPKHGNHNTILASGNLLGTNDPREIEVIRTEMINLNNAVKDPNSHIHRNYKTQLERVNAILQRNGSAIRCNAKVDSKGQKRTQASIILANIPIERKIFENLDLQPTLTADGSVADATMYVLGNRPLDTIFFNKPTEVELIVERSLGIQIATHPTSVADFPGGFERSLDGGTIARRRDRQLGSSLQSVMHQSNMLPTPLNQYLESLQSQASVARASGAAQAAAFQAAAQPSAAQLSAAQLSAAQAAASQAAASQAAAQADVGEEEMSLINIARREVADQRSRELNRLMTAGLMSAPMVTSMIRDKDDDDY